MHAFGAPLIKMIGMNIIADLGMLYILKLSL